jgi:hypothetical protein
MTNTTNSSAHAACTHPRTKVARAICRRQRAASIKSAKQATYTTIQGKGSKTTHYAIFDDSISIPACTGKPFASPDYALSEITIDERPTCPRCAKLDASTLNASMRNI